MAEIKCVLTVRFDAKNTLDNSRKTARVNRTYMKNSPLTTVLLGVLTVSALASVVLCWLYISNIRELRSFQAQANIINNNRAVMSALANDAVEYSKKNPAIDPILESVGLKPSKSATSTSTRPTTK